jgi:mannose-6-phosphate isomerase-like protein (cupin superfamily)
METHVGELYENPVTGERGVVRVPPRQSNGQLLVVDLYVRPGGAVAREHVHPATTETFTVVRGELAVHHGGRELRAVPGTRLRVPPGVAHDLWNAGADQAHVVVEVQPGERWLRRLRPPPLERLLRRKPPIVDPEPLPAEIAELIPGLAARPRWPNTTTVAAGR